MRKILFILSLLLCSVTGFSQRAGDLDSSFARNGILRLNTCLPYGITVYSDGRILVAGDYHMSLARFFKDGSRDSSFGGIGEVHYNPDTPEHNWIWPVVLAAHNKIVVGGSWEAKSGTYFYVARFNDNGTFDSSFASNGIFRLNTPPWASGCSAIAIQSNGYILAAGGISDSFGAKNLIVRIDTNGILDSSFGINGIVTTVLDTAYVNETAAISIQPDNKFIVGGLAENKFSVIRYNYDGSLDKSFASGGFNLFPSASMNLQSANSVQLQKDGKIIFGGWGSFDSTTSFYLIARLDSSGSLDSSFGNKGLTAINCKDSNSHILSSVALQTDGKIIAVGGIQGFFSSIFQFGVARLNQDGTLDSTFGDNGIAINDFSTHQYNVPYCSVMQDDELLVGGIGVDSTTRFVVVRYLTVAKLGVLDFKNDITTAVAYPNPVNQNTTVEYELSNDENISIALSDMQGRLVKTIITNARQERGTHTLSMPFNSLQNGVYILQIKSNAGSSYIKLVKNM